MKVMLVPRRFLVLSTGAVPSLAGSVGRIVPVALQASGWPSPSGALSATGPGCWPPLSTAAFSARPVLAQVHKKLDSELTGLHPALQVDVVWALCVLRQAREAELRAVLRPELHGQFLGEGWGVPPPKPTAAARAHLLLCASARAGERRPPELTWHSPLLCPLPVGDPQTLFPDSACGSGCSVGAGCSCPPPGPRVPLFSRCLLP